MRDTLQSSLQRFTRGFAAFTPAQKVIALLGTGALLLAAVLVFRWVAQPQYAPLFTNLSPADASAVVDKLDGTGVSYKLTDGGTSVLVPQDDVYKTRISLSGAGLPSGKDGGYSLLDKPMSLSTSTFQEQTIFKRAMEGELSKTIEAMDGVQTAVVHLAMPEKQVFADKQAPPTASVLVSTNPGAQLSPEQVQSIVHLVAASIDGMDPAKVTVADSTGRLLTADDGSGSSMASTRDQAQQKYQSQMADRLQAMLDQVVGPGNGRVEVTADLNFDKATVDSKTYAEPKKPLALSQQKNSETYKGAAAQNNAGGVVGPDGQMDPTTTTGGTTPSTYDKRSETTDSALDTKVEHVVTAPGTVRTLHVAVALDRTAAANNNPQEIEKMLRSAAGIQPKRGDTMWLSVLPFDRSGQAAAAKELKAQQAEAAAAGRMSMYRNIALGALVLFGLVIAWLRSRKRNKARAEATNYVIEQLKREPAPEPLPSPATALLSLEGNADDVAKRELTELVERQPEDVAALLRGWLVER